MPMEPHEQNPGTDPQPVGEHRELDAEARAILKYVFDTEMAEAAAEMESLQQREPDPLASMRELKEWSDETGRLNGRIKTLAFLRARLLGEELPTVDVEVIPEDSPEEET